MRTTIRIDDELYREVKIRAAQSERTVAAVLEDAVRTGLHVPEQRDRERYRVRATGSGGLRPGVSLTSNAAVADDLDEDTPLNALR